MLIIIQKEFLNLDHSLIIIIEKDINFPAGHKDYSGFEKNNSDIAINLLYVPHNNKQVKQTYISKHNNELVT